MRSPRVVAVVAIACVAGLTGCSASSSTPNPSAAEWVSTTPEGKGALDAITWDLPQGEPASLNWVRTGAASDNTVLSTLCEGLLKQTPDGYQPSLAESWDAPDDKTYVYHLHHGVKFTDGTEMTADDVVYSLATQKDPNAGSYWSLYFAHVTSIEAVDRYTVKVSLDQPDALFNQMMATVAGTVVEKRFATANAKSYGTAEGGVMCTGPYVLDSWKSGDSIVVKANADYWDTAHKPKIATVKFTFITNPSTLVQGLQSGEIDGAFDFPVSAVQSLTSSSAGTLYLGASTKFVDVGFSAKGGATANPAIRQALALALDKQAITSSLFGAAGKSVRSPFFESTWSYGADIFKKAYNELPAGGADLGAARKLVKAAGSPGETLKLLSNADDPTAQQLAAYVQAQAKAIGLKVQLTSMPASQFSTASFDLTQRNQYDLVVNTASYYDIPDPLFWAFGTLAEGAPYNFSDYKNADVTQWTNEALGTTVESARAGLMAKISGQAYGKDFVSITIANPASLLFMNHRISGAPATYTSHLYSPWILSVGATK